MGARAGGIEELRAVLLEHGEHRAVAIREDVDDDRAALEHVLQQRLAAGAPDCLGGGPRARRTSAPLACTAAAAAARKASRPASTFGTGCTEPIAGDHAASPPVSAVPTPTLHPNRFRERAAASVPWGLPELRMRTRKHASMGQAPQGERRCVAGSVQAAEAARAQP